MFQKSQYKFIIVPLLVLLVALSGCLNAELNTKLNKDFSGTKSMHLEMAPILYSAMEGNLSRESITLTPGAELVSYKKDVKDDKVILDIVVNYRDMRTVNNTRISEHDNILRFEDMSFENIGDFGKGSQMMAGSISIKYTLEMPYKIDNSNADTIDGNKATWVITGLSSRTLYAESKIPAIPGFTVISFLVAILVLIFRKRRG